MKYLFQVYNSVYGYWEADMELSSAQAVMQAMAIYRGFKTRYRRI